jgi:hypothetical protein
LQEVNEEREAKLVVVSYWKGVVGDGGTMARPTVVLSGAHRKRKREGGGAREKERGLEIRVSQ